MAIDEATERIYDRADFGHRMGFGETPAVVVVDFQYGMTDPDNPLGADYETAIEQTNRLVDVAHDADIPVIWTRMVYKHPDAADGGVLVKKMPEIARLKAGTRWVEIDDRCHLDEEDHILDKRQGSAFHETELSSMLTAWGIDTVIVAGCVTSGCVRATVADSCFSGYHAIVPLECVGDRAERQHEANIWDIQQTLADVVPREEVQSYLRSASGTASVA